MRPDNPLSTEQRRWREVHSRPYRETLQTTGFYLGRIVIVTREFASIPSPPSRCLREYGSPDYVFSGMAESIGPIGSLKLLQAGAGVPPPVGRPRIPTKGRDGRGTPCPSSTMSSGRLFLDRVARQQSPSPLPRQPDHKTLDTSEERNYH